MDRCAGAASTCTSGRSWARSTRGAPAVRVGLRLLSLQRAALPDFDTLDVGSGFAVDYGVDGPAPGHRGSPRPGRGRDRGTAADARPRGWPSSPGAPWWRPRLARRPACCTSGSRERPTRRPGRGHDRAHPARPVRGRAPDGRADHPRRGRSRPGPTASRSGSTGRSASRPIALGAARCHPPPGRPGRHRRGRRLRLIDGQHVQRPAADLPRSAGTAIGSSFFDAGDGSL